MRRISEHTRELLRNQLTMADILAKLSPEEEEMFLECIGEWALESRNSADGREPSDDIEEDE